MKKMMIIGHADCNTKIKISQEGRLFATVLVVVNVENSKSKIDLVELIFNDKLMNFAIKYVIKDTKLITIGVPLINAYTNKKGEIVANQKIYVEKIELLGKADNTQEFKIIDCETTTDF